MRLTVYLLLILCLIGLIAAKEPISKPFASNSQQPESVFTKKDVLTMEEVLFGTDATKSSTKKCHHHLDILWTTELKSPIYQTPHIVDFYNDGKKEIIIPTFARYIEVLNGENGKTAPGWPFTHSNFKSHASILLYDIDKDGHQEIVTFTESGTVLFLKQDGTILSEQTIKLLPLPVNKYWFKGLQVDDISKLYTDIKPDVTKTEEEFEKDHKSLQEILRDVLDENGHISRKLQSIDNHRGSFHEHFRSRKLCQLTPDTIPKKIEERNEDAKNAEKKDIGPSLNHLSMEAKASMDQLLTNLGQYEREENVFISKSYNEELNKLKKDHPDTEERKYLFVDPHILATPVIVDLDSDGKDEIVFAVSYYFDKQHYSNPDNMNKLEVDIDIRNYVASAIVVVDIESGETKWTTHLGLTTDKTNLRAYAYATPTIADIDGDGSLDIVIGNSLGSLYALDHKGELKPNFPVQMGEIQSQVAVEDVNGDGEIEIIALDFLSNVACFDFKGKLKWSRQLSGKTSHTPVLGDVNGDGKMELVVGTSEGFLWAINAENGANIPHFPIKTKGPIVASPLVISTKIRKTKKKSFDIVFSSKDNFIYFVNAETGCIFKIDIGEYSYSQILADDISGSGKLNLILTTVNGNVYCFGTDIPYHPLNTQQFQTGYINGFSVRYKNHGIHITKGSRVWRDITGSSFRIMFTITDNRILPPTIDRKYTVEFRLGNKYKFYRTEVFDKPGRYLVRLPAPNVRDSMTIHVLMTNENGQSFTDQCSISFNIHFMKIIKWIIVVPFIAMIIGLYITLPKSRLVKEAMVAKALDQ